MWVFRSHFTAAADKLIVVIRASRVDLAGGGWVGEDDGMTLSSGDCVGGGGVAPTTRCVHFSVHSEEHACDSSAPTAHLEVNKSYPSLGL